MRKCTDWLSTFMEYSGYGEAPKRMYFWSGVSALAGALRRHVWIDEVHFQWYPNFYIIIVAPPGIVSKSTTTSIAHNLLREMPEIEYGPDIVTWPALVEEFSHANQGFEYNQKTYTMSAITLEASEFGNLFDPNDREMVDLFVHLWDGKQGKFKKNTKGSGKDQVQNAWINMIACTTPSWIGANFPETLIGGGFTSRCIFVYADRKERLVPYPSRLKLDKLKEQKANLLHDLEYISKKLIGEYILTEEAIKWGSDWYKKHHTSEHAHLNHGQFGGYLARKQTHIHKLAMVLAASSSDELILTEEHLKTAHTMVTDLEPDLAQVYSKIGKSDTSLYTDKLLEFIEQKKEVKFSEMYRYVHSHFPSIKDFEDIVAGCVRAGYISLESTPDGVVVRFQRSQS